jgi:5'-deoxynucleotidase YfbR-like HD superfamily hydrolase
MNNALTLITNGGRVRRFHAKATLKEETVAEHSYLVAWLVTLGADYNPGANLILAALQHDIPECELGDMPGPTKVKMSLGAQFEAAEAEIFKAAGMPDFGALLCEKDAQLLKLCDNLAGWLKCVYERQLGSTMLLRTEANYAAYIMSGLAKEPDFTNFASAVMLAAELGAA